MLAKDLTVLPFSRDLDLDYVQDLHEECFPIAYDQEFYSSLSKKNRICFVAWMGSEICGTISSFVDRDSDGVYLMTLGVPKKYRRQGIGSMLVQTLLEKVRKDYPMFWTVSLHVLRENEEATEFYLQRGFRVVRLVTGHYQIDDKPRDAYLMEFKLDRASKTSLLMSQLYRLCRK